MTSQLYITKNESLLTRRRKDAESQRNCRNFSYCYRSFLNFAPLRLCVFALIFIFPVKAQKIAVLTPDKTDTSRNFAERLEDNLAKKVSVLDNGMSEAAFSSAKLDDPFNMTLETSKSIGGAIGCDFFILVKSDTLRRSSSKSPQYYESYAVIYVISTRTGRLVFWRLSKFETVKSPDAQNLMYESVPALASELASKIKSKGKDEIAEPPVIIMEEPPNTDSQLAKNFRAPVPYRRIKPEYTAEASLYDIKATVDIMVDLNAEGSILRTEIVRWAGYGLDESVERAVSAMKWRPAERNGKTLPMRFLLRYNFKKIEKE